MSWRAVLPPRLLSLVAPVYAAGALAAAAAAVAFATSPPGATTLIGIAALLSASLLVERFPVPVEGVEATRVSLSFVFSLSAILLFGWAAGVLVAFAAPAIMQLVERRPPIRVAYNASVFAIGATAAGALAGRISGDGVDALLVRVTACASVQVAVNLVLVTAVVAATSERTFLGLIASSVRLTIMTFVFMGSAALMLVVLWQRSPLLSAALVGPLLAIALYQRSTFRALQAVRLASTDPLTGVGNHRHFHERLQRELLEAEASGGPLSLCLLDVDDFKRVNDRFGHPAGDRVLAHLAARLRQDGEAFRLGGDEFAIVLPGHDVPHALTAAEAIVRRIRTLRLDQGGPVTVSAGIASFPAQASERDELIRLADTALYWAKEHGKNCAWAYRPDAVELGRITRLSDGADRAVALHAAASLARAVDARDSYTGGHSERVAQLAGRIAARIELGREEIELARLAGRLHDLGKLAMPEDILRRSRPLSAADRQLLQRHPQIGFRMLECLGVSPVDTWVLHHHERWDGTGYPDGLRGAEIPLGARIVFVADAFDAMTSDRVYGGQLSVEEALAELERCAGSQFDPELVAALAAELGLAPESAEAALAS